MSIQVTQFYSVKSKVPNRTAHCKNCFDRKALLPGEKKIILSNGFKLSLYLCKDCALHEAKLLRDLADNIFRAVDGIIDTEAAFYMKMRRS